jgi:hypothetical protein
MKCAICKEDSDEEICDDCLRAEPGEFDSDGVLRCSRCLEFVSDDASEDDDEFDEDDDEFEYYEDDGLCRPCAAFVHSLPKAIEQARRSIVGAESLRLEVLPAAAPCPICQVAVGDGFNAAHQLLVHKRRGALNPVQIGVGAWPRGRFECLVWSQEAPFAVLITLERRRKEIKVSYRFVLGGIAGTPEFLLHARAREALQHLGAALGLPRELAPFAFADAA